MASKFWIKLYHEILDDPKMGRLNDGLWRRFIECLLLAGEFDRDGYLPPLDDMAWRFRVSPELLEAELNDLGRLGMVEMRDAGWYVTHFSKRQEAVGNTERWRKWRDRQHKQEYYGDVTDSQPASNEAQTYRLTDIDIDKNRIDVDKSGLQPPKYEHPLPETQQRIITELKLISKTPYWEDTYSKYDEAATAIIGWDCGPDDVPGFLPFWENAARRAKAAGKDYPYLGLPALKSILEEWSNYQRSLNGHVDEMVPGVDFKVFDEVDE